MKKYAFLGSFIVMTYAAEAITIQNDCSSPIRAYRISSEKYLSLLNQAGKVKVPHGKIVHTASIAENLENIQKQLRPNEKTSISISTHTTHIASEQCPNLYLTSNTDIDELDQAAFRLVESEPVPGVKLCYCVPKI